MARTKYLLARKLSLTLFQQWIQKTAINKDKRIPIGLIVSSISLRFYCICYTICLLQVCLRWFKMKIWFWAAFIQFFPSALSLVNPIPQLFPTKSDYFLWLSNEINLFIFYFFSIRCSPSEENCVRLWWRSQSKIVTQSMKRMLLNIFYRPQNRISLILSLSRSRSLSQHSVNFFPLNTEHGLRSPSSFPSAQPEVSGWKPLRFEMCER